MKNLFLRAVTGLFVLTAPLIARADSCNALFDKWNNEGGTLAGTGFNDSFFDSRSFLSFNGGDLYPCKLTKELNTSGWSRCGGQLLQGNLEQIRDKTGRLWSINWGQPTTLVTCRRNEDGSYTRVKKETYRGILADSESGPSLVRVIEYGQKLIKIRPSF